MKRSIFVLGFVTIFLSGAVQLGNSLRNLQADHAAHMDRVMSMR